MKFKYFSQVRHILDIVEKDESDHMEQSVNLLEQCVLNHGAIYIFGASHAGILSEEMFYRAGGLMLINPIFGRETMLDSRPVTLTSDMERLVGYGTILAKQRAKFKESDAGAKVIAITNLAYSRSIKSRHSSGKRLFELADIVLDNHGDVGDATVQIRGINQKVGPTSTVVGASMLNAIIAELVQRLVDNGMDEPPVFYSANIDGGDELNHKLFEKYKDSIKYQF
jgi:uncharacterized phosphosugar-binding protein